MTCPPLQGEDQGGDGSGLDETHPHPSLSLKERERFVEIKK